MVIMEGVAVENRLCNKVGGTVKGLMSLFVRVSRSRRGRVGIGGCVCAV